MSCTFKMRARLIWNFSSVVLGVGGGGGVGGCNRVRVLIEEIWYVNIPGSASTRCQ